MSNMEESSFRRIWVNGPVIVGAGPSGLAVAACLRQQDVPFIILEKSDCIASLWNYRTYHRLKLHLPKRYCELPHLPFPEDYPEYPSKYQFISYLETYAKLFDINPNFRETVSSATYDDHLKRWRVKVMSADENVEYFATWLVVATGENAEKVAPEIEGLEDFGGEVIHASEYKSGESYEGKRVVVVGCGNTGMEVSLDLANFQAKPLMVVRNPVHVLPRDIFGKSTYELVFLFMKWLPLSILDKLFILLARLILGNLEKYGLRRPIIGPLQLKEMEGRTPVLDIGALEKIKSGKIKIVPGIKRFTRETIEFADEQVHNIDAVIFATGYRSNVPTWLKENEFFAENGIPKCPFPNGWKGNDGIYAVGFSKKGLYGVSIDSVRIAEDISCNWRREIEKHNKNKNVDVA